MPKGRDSPDWKNAATILGTNAAGWTKQLTTKATQAGAGRDTTVKLKLLLEGGKSVFYTNPKYKRHLKQQSTRVSVAHLAQELQKQSVRHTLFNRVLDQVFVQKLSSALGRAKEWISQVEKHFVEMIVVQKDIRARCKCLLNIVGEDGGPGSRLAEDDEGVEDGGFGAFGGGGGGISVVKSEDGIFSRGMPGTSMNARDRLLVESIDADNERLMYVTALRPLEKLDMQATMFKVGKIPLSTDQQNELRTSLDNGEFFHWSLQPSAFLFSLFFFFSF